MNFYSLCRRQPEHGAELWMVNKAPDSVWAEDKELFVFALSLKIKLLSSQNKTILSSRTRAGLTTGLNSRSPEICRLTVCQPTPASLSTRRSRRKYTVKQQSCKKSQIIKHVPMRRCDDELINTTSCLTLMVHRPEIRLSSSSCWLLEAWSQTASGSRDANTNTTGKQLYQQTSQHALCQRPFSLWFKQIIRDESSLIRFKSEVRSEPSLKCSLSCFSLCWSSLADSIFRLTLAPVAPLAVS